MAKSPQRPISGLRLNYEIKMEGALVRVRIKQPIGNWLGLTPTGPSIGQFGNPDGSTVGSVLAQAGGAIPGGYPHQGLNFLRQPAGYKFQSYTFLVQPGTKLTEAIPGDCEGGTRERLICTFSIGFPRGRKNNRVTRWRVQKWIRGTKRKDDIYGMITPSGVQHIWAERKGKSSNLLPSGVSLPSSINTSNILSFAAQAADLLF